MCIPALCNVTLPSSGLTFDVPSPIRSSPPQPWHLAWAWLGTDVRPQCLWNECVNSCEVPPLGSSKPRIYKSMGRERPPCAQGWPTFDLVAPPTPAGSRAAEQVCPASQNGECPLAPGDAGFPAVLSVGWPAPLREAWVGLQRARACLMGSRLWGLESEHGAH